MAFRDLPIVDRYGDRYNRILRNELGEIENRIFRIARRIETGEIEFSRRLTYLTAQRENIKSFITGRVGDVRLQALQGSFAEVLRASNADFAAVGLKDVPFKESDIGAFKSLNKNQSVFFELMTEQDATNVFDGLLRWAIGGSKSAIRPFFQNMDDLKFARYGKTIINSHVQQFYRAANFAKGNNAGVKRYRYDGPSPDRQFCNSIFQGVFTLQEIEMMDNGQFGDVITSAGGYNCRHRWTPIAPTEDDERGGAEKTEAEVRERLEKKGVVKRSNRKAIDNLPRVNLRNRIILPDGRIGPASRGVRTSVLVKDSRGRNLQNITRTIRRSESGNLFYNRFDGDRQFLKQDRQGNLYITGRKGGNALPKTGRTEKITVNPEPTTLEGLQNKLKKAIPSLKHVDLSGMEVGIAEKVTNNLIDMAKQFKTGLTSITTDRQSFAIFASVRGVEAMNFNTILYKNPDVMRKFYVSGYKNIVPSNVIVSDKFVDIAVSTHEFAHTIYDVQFGFGAGRQAIPQLQSKIKGIFKRYNEAVEKISDDFKANKITLDQYRISMFKTKMSSYASTNADEFMAESFTQVMLAKQDASPFALEVFDALKEFVGL